MKSIFIFGATGSIGQNALKIIENNTNFKLVGFSYNNNLDLAQKIKIDFNVENTICHKNNDDWKSLLLKLKPDIVLNSISGFGGIEITEFCIKNKIKLALANKESIVVAGSLINFEEDIIYPVDSEHSSLYELIHSKPNDIKTIYITASGGPFYHLTNEQSFNKTFEETIKHPVWDMGYKISIDSATLINKCFEMIEAYYLFNTKNIFAIYHPTSIVHALVEYKNNSIISYMSYPDMKIAIDLAINEFKTSLTLIPSLELNNLDLHFEIIPVEKYRPLQWVYELMNTNNSAMGTIITIVDDYLINLFKNHQLLFGEIVLIIDEYLSKYKTYKITNWNDIYQLKSILIDDLNSRFK